MRNAPAYPKMDAIAWVVAGNMLREGQPAAGLYAIRTDRLTIEVDRAPGRVTGGPKELTLTRLLPNVALVAGAGRLGYRGVDPPAFVYPPGAALLGIPLSWLGWPAATFVMDLLGLCALGGATALIVTRLRGPSWGSLAWFGVMLTLFTVSHPVRFSLFLGQLTPFLALGWIVLWLPDNRRGAVAAGIVVGLLGVLKVFPLLLALWFLVRRRWLSLAIACAVFVSGCLALGFDALSAWLVAARQMAAPVRVWTENQSLAAMLHRFVYPLNLVRDWVIVSPAPAWSISVCAGVLMLAGWTWCAARRVEVSAPCQLALFGTLWIVPMSLSALFWSHYIVLVLPVLVVVLADPGRGAASLCTAAIAGVFLLIGGDAWTTAMPSLERALGSGAAAFAMRWFVSLPTVAMGVLFFIGLFPSKEQERVPTLNAGG
jgi:hypothetical protein